MVKYFYCNNGKYESGNAKNYSEFKKKEYKKGFLCILLQSPTEAETSALGDSFHLEQKYFRKFKNETRSLRYDFKPLTFTFTDYYILNADIRASHLLFIIRNDLLILVTSEKSNYYIELFEKVIGNAQGKGKYSTAYILYEFLRQDSKENYDVLEMMDEKIMTLEEKVLSKTSNDRAIIHDIVSFKKDLLKMRKTLWASSKIIFTIKKDLTSIRLTKEEYALLDDIYDTFLHQIDLIETQTETVTDYLEIFTTTISNRLAATSNELNMVMKKMAALTIIIMVPSLIAGIYGTNFHNLPEITWQYGYLYLWGLMIAAAALTYYFFHRKGWV